MNSDLQKRKWVKEKIPKVNTKTPVKKYILRIINFEQQRSKKE